VNTFFGGFNLKKMSKGVFSVFYGDKLHTVICDSNKATCGATCGVLRDHMCKSLKLDESKFAIAKNLDEDKAIEDVYYHLSKHIRFVDLKTGRNVANLPVDEDFSWERVHKLIPGFALPNSIPPGSVLFAGTYRVTKEEKEPTTLTLDELRHEFLQLEKDPLCCLCLYGMIGGTDLDLTDLQRFRYLCIFVGACQDAALIQKMIHFLKAQK
jgi:hypothetical protein